MKRENQGVNGKELRYLGAQVVDAKDRQSP
jgi:hypothetical protein